MNSDYLHVDLPDTEIKASVSDAMIGPKEEASDSNPWENVGHNDRLCLETPSPFMEEEKTKEIFERGGKRESDFLFLSMFLFFSFFFFWDLQKRPIRSCVPRR